MAKFRLGKIVNKYLIVEIINYGQNLLKSQEPDVHFMVTKNACLDAVIDTKNCEYYDEEWSLMLLFGSSR